MPNFTSILGYTEILGICVAIPFFILIFLKPEMGLYLIIFSMLLSPEIKVVSFPGRDLVIRFEDLLLIVVTFSWLARMAIYKIGFVKKNPLNFPIFLYLFMCILSTFIAYIEGNPNLCVLKSTFYILKYAEYFIIFFMAANIVKNKEDVEKYFALFLIVAFIVSLYGIYSVFIYGRATAPFEGFPGEPNTLGGYLILLISVSLSYFLYSDDKTYRVLIGIALFFMAIAFLFTLSRASYMGFPFMFLSLFLTRKRKIFLTLLFFFIISFSLVGLPEVVKNRIKYTFTPNPRIYTTIGRLKLGPSASARILSWKDCIKAWKKRPFFGYGITGYGFIDGQYVRVLTETGIIGTVSFGFLLISLVVFLYKKFRRTTDYFYESICLGVLSGLIGLIIHAIGSNTFIIIRIMEPFLFFVGMIVNFPEKR